MSLINYNNNTENNQLKQSSRKYFNHLTEQQRKNIERYLSMGYSKAQIAKELGVHRSTIAREIERGLWNYKTDANGRQYKYQSDVGQSRASQNKRSSKRKPILNSESPFITLIRKIVKNFYISLFHAHCIIKEITQQDEKFKDFKMVSVTTLYKYADKGILKLKNIYFPYGLKIKHKSASKEAKSIQKGENISNRPEEANNRSEFGHWEGDTVVGPKKGSKACLLTLVERMTRAVIAIKLPDKTCASVKAAFDMLELKLGKQLFKSLFKTVTFDNGTEFLHFQELERSTFSDEKRFDAFYADAYSSWERGSNENANRWLRRYFPKGTDFDLVTQGEINVALGKINYIKRRKLKNRSSGELLNELNLPILESLEITNPFLNIKSIINLHLTNNCDITIIR